MDRHPDGEAALASTSGGQLIERAWPLPLRGLREDVGTAKDSTGLGGLSDQGRQHRERKKQTEGQQEGERGQQPEGAADVKGGEVYRPGGCMLVDEQARDQEAREDEEDGHA